MKHYSDFTVSDWLFYLENRYQEEIQLGLSRVSQVAEFLHLLQPNAQVITVAGTNGKGSTVTCLEAIYLAAGYRVASYTSPHLLVFNERIRVNQQDITDKQLCEAFCVVEEARGSVHLTYFEMATLAALWHFKQHTLDLIILEVGLGGRLDATNIISADLAIITTIDLDHQSLLGDTKEAIGYEKAGILRPNKPFIFADTNPPASVLHHALSLKSVLYCYGKNYQANLKEGIFQFVFKKEKIDLPPPPLHCNAVSAAIMASLCLRAALPVSYSQLAQGIQRAFLPGRLHVIQDKVATLFDVSHNPQAVNHLANFIKKRHPQGAVRAVFSALKDKDIEGLITPMHDCISHWYPAVLPGKRAASREQLESVFSIHHNPLPLCYNSPLSAYHAACNEAKLSDLIIVYGSFITVGIVMSALYSARK